jgi:alpha-glucosidase
MLNISNGAGIVVFSLNGMILSEYMNYIDLKVYTDRTFKTGVLGLTERLTNDLFLDDGVYSLWARDTQDLDSGHPGNNLYGTHPFFMGRSPNDDRGRASTGWFGVFANNAAAQDWWIKNNHDNGAVDVKTIATGGVGDLYIMFHRTPDGVNKMYHSIVGTPVLTPQWALGWHQSRVGYNSTEVLKEVVANYSAAGIPLDTQWSAFDYMKDYRDFTYDKESSSFAELG